MGDPDHATGGPATLCMGASAAVAAAARHGQKHRDRDELLSVLVEDHPAGGRHGLSQCHLGLGRAPAAGTADRGNGDRAQLALSKSDPVLRRSRRVAGLSGRHHRPPDLLAGRVGRQGSGAVRGMARNGRPVYMGPDGGLHARCAAPWRPAGEGRHDWPAAALGAARRELWRGGEPAERHAPIFHHQHPVDRTARSVVPDASAGRRPHSLQPPVSTSGEGGLGVPGGLHLCSWAAALGVHLVPVVVSPAPEAPSSDT